MICRLYAQQQKGQQLGAELIALLASGHYSSLTVVVAFLRSEGVDQLKDALEQFVASGHKTLFIVGISGRVTSYEGLKVLLETVKEGSVTIFHNANSSAGIFHPKLYLFEGKQRITVVIASNNFTRPGLFVNYELATLIDIDPQKKEDQQFHADLDSYIAELMSNGDVAKQLTSELLEKLKETGAIQSEAKEPKTDEEAEEEAAAKLERTARQAKIKGLFGSAPVTAAPANKKQSTQTKAPAKASSAAASPRVSATAGPKFIMRAYVSRGSQVQVPIPASFFHEGDKIISSHNHTVRTIHPARSHGRQNTLKLEIPESRTLEIPILVFERTSRGVVYTALEGKIGEGAKLLAILEKGLADGSTKQTRQGSTMYRIE